jgi:hypothetical protein
VFKHGNPKQRMLIFTLTILGCIFILFFGLRIFHISKKFNGGLPLPPRPPGEIETDVEKIREWMTIPFVSRMYGVPEKIPFEATGISPERNHKKSIEELNEEYFPTVDGFIIKQIKSAVRAHQPPPTPDAPLTPLPPLTPIPSLPPDAP